MVARWLIYFTSADAPPCGDGGTPFHMGYAHHRKRKCGGLVLE